MEVLVLTRFIQFIITTFVLFSNENNTNGSTVTTIFPRTNTNLNDIEQCGQQIRTRGLVHNSNADDSIVMRGEFPWSAAIMKIKKLNEQFMCGGTLINSDSIVTVAHCIQRKAQQNAYQAADIKILLGAYNISDKTEPYRKEFDVVGILTHGGWDPDQYANFSNNIALLKLKNEVDRFTPMIRPICLMNSREISNIKSGTISGYGEFSEDRGISSKIPLRVELPIVTCEKWILKQWKLAEAYSEDAFVAGSETGGVCPGDCGSGFYVTLNGRYYLRGIVSAGVIDEDYNCTHHDYVLYADILKHLESFIIPALDIDKASWKHLHGSNRNLMV